jgi:ankyrin repeat protein
MSAPIVSAVPHFVRQNPIPTLVDALPPPLPPLPACLLPPPLPSVDVLADWGMSGGRKEATQGEIDEFLKLKIAELEQKVVQDQTQRPSVRSDLCKLSCISEVYYGARKAEVFDLLRRLFETDPATKQTVAGVLTEAIKLNNQFGTAHLLSIPFQQKLARTFSAAVALYLRHYEKKDHVNAVTQPQKEEFLKTIKQFESLNTQKDTSLRFAQKMAHEALKRLVSDRKEIEDMLDRMGLVADALKSAYNKDLAQFCSKMAAAFKDIGDKMPKKWFEAYYAMQKAIWMVNDDLQRIDFIAVMLATKKTDYGWKFIYGALEDLETIVGRKGQRRECTERALAQVEKFIAFNGFVDKARVASDDDRRDDERVRKKAQELQKVFKEKLESSDKTAHEQSNVPPALTMLPMRQPQPTILMLPPSQPAPQPHAVNVAFHVTTEQPSVPQPVPLPPLTRTEIFQSVRDGSITKETIERLKKTNGDPINEFRDEEGNTLLMVAAWEGNRTICELFIAAGAVCTTTRISDGRTALHFAAMRNHQGIVLLFSTNPDLILAKDFEQSTPLIITGLLGHLGSFNILLKLSTASDRRIALGVAAIKGHHGIVEACCKESEYFQTENFGLALCCGAREGHVKVCRAVINYASISNKTDEILATTIGEEGFTPILWAAESRAKGSLEIGELLLAAGADPTTICLNCKNALHLAVGSSKVEFAELLLRQEKFRRQLLSAYMVKTAGISASLISLATNKFRTSSTKSEIEKGNISAMAWGFGALSNDVPIYPPMIQSLSCEKPVEMIILLLRYGADPCLTDQFGYNALHHAIKKVQIQIVTLLLQSKFKAALLHEPKDKLRITTVMTEAVKCTQPVEMCTLLREAGADPTSTITAYRTVYHDKFFGANALKMAFIMLDQTNPWGNAKVDFNALFKCLILKHPTLVKTVASNFNLRLAVCRGLTEIVDALLVAGADPYAASYSITIVLRDSKSRTTTSYTIIQNVLHVAAASGRLEIVQRLLSIPYRDLNAQDNTGKTALKLAKNKAIRELLIAAGAQEGEEQEGKEKASCAIM